MKFQVSENGQEPKITLYPESLEECAGLQWLAIHLNGSHSVFRFDIVTYPDSIMRPALYIDSKWCSR